MSEFPGDPGRPFGDDYDNLRAASGIDAHVRQRVQKQVTELTQRRSDDRRRRSIAGAIQTRWADLRETRIDLVTTTEGPDSLVVGGEILLRRTSWDDRQIRAYVKGQGLRRERVGCEALESRLVRLVADESVTSRQLDDIVAELRDRGHAASLTHLTPLQPVIKACSSVAASAIETFSEYPVSSGDSDGVKVAVVDTGIEGRIRTDGWLAGVPRTPDAPATAPNESNIDPLDIDPLDGLLDFSAGHGTFVSGIVAQVAPGADITVYRALTTAGTGSEIDVACALIHAVRDGAQIVNLSLGTQTLSDQPALAIAAALEVIAEIERDTESEVLIVAAAGNFGDTVPTWPAAFRRVISVGSLTSDLRPSTFSSRGWWVDCATVGEGILSTYVQGEQSPAFTDDPETFGPNAFARWTGTSFAAPQVTGAIARIAQTRGISARQAYVQLLAAGRPLPDFGQTFSILPGV
ncbi:S8 family peptidase [Cellulomonas sp. P5_C5]